MQLKTFFRDKICFASRFVPRKRFKLPRIIKLCHFVLRKRFRQNQIIAAKDMVTAAPQRSWSAQPLGETVRKVKHSSVRTENLLLALYSGAEHFSLAMTFRTVWGKAEQVEHMERVWSIIQMADMPQSAFRRSSVFRLFHTFHGTEQGRWF